MELCGRLLEIIFLMNKDMILERKSLYETIGGSRTFVTQLHRDLEELFAGLYLANNKCI